LFDFQFVFSSEKEADEAYDMLSSLWDSCNTRTISRAMSMERGMKDIAAKYRDREKDPEDLTQDDWGFLLQGAKMPVYERGQKIIGEGEQFQRIYQIVKGTCRIEKAAFEKPIGSGMGPGQTFGEISFLLSGGATASVIADSDTVEVYILEGYFMNIVFSMKPELAGRFYKYLATMLQRRIRSREEDKPE
jgi:signal-transduction protein with cAMP-binding, CBS, and nucleotidyltransferase domain